MADDIPKPYYRIVDRKEVFGSGDTGTRTVIQLINVKKDSYIPLKPVTEDPQVAKDKYLILQNMVTSDKFTDCKDGEYYEYNRELSESKLKQKMEALGFHEYD